VLPLPASHLLSSTAEASIVSHHHHPLLSSISSISSTIATPLSSHPQPLSLKLQPLTPLHRPIASLVCRPLPSNHRLLSAATVASRPHDTPLVRRIRLHRLSSATGGPPLISAFAAFCPTVSLFLIRHRRLSSPPLVCHRCPISWLVVNVKS